MIALVLRTGLYQISDKGYVIRAALATGGSEGTEGRFLTAGAFDQDVRGAPPVDLAHLHVLNLVVRLDALDDLRHWHLSLSPQVVDQAECVNIKARGGTRLCPVTLSAPRHITSLRVSCDTSGLPHFCYTSYVMGTARYRISAH